MRPRATKGRPSRVMIRIPLLATLSLVCLGAQNVSVTGPPVPQLAAYDQFMTGFMTQYGIPAAQLAITHNGKLIFARGYGALNPADPSDQTAVQPDTLFRVAIE